MAKVTLGHNLLMRQADLSDRQVVVWMSLAQLVTWGSVFYTFALLMEPLEQELGMSRAQVSLGFSLALLAEGLLAFPIGRLIDRGFDRWVMAGGSLWVGLCLMLHSQIDSLWSFYAIWTALGAGLAATLYTPAFAVVTRRFPQDFRRAIITMTFLGGLASTVFIPLSAWLISELGWRQALLCLAALQFLLCLPIHAVVLRKPMPALERPVALPGDAPVAGLRHFIMSAPFLSIATFVMLMMAVTAALPPHLVSMLRESGLSEAWAIAIPASIGLLQVVGRLLLYFFERHFDLHLANCLIPWLIPLGLTALLLSQSRPEVALLFVLLFGLGNGMLTIVKGTAIAHYVNRDHVASLNGALGLPSALARALAPLALGLLWSSEQGYQTGIWMLLAASVVAGLAMWQAQRRSLIPLRS